MKEIEKTEIEVSWESLPDAKAYELEFQPVEGSGEVLNFSTVESTFKVFLVPGSYRFRIRSIDSMNDKGEWSEPLTLVAQSQEVALISPVNNVAIESKGKRERVEFSWNPYAEAKGYIFRIWSETKNEVHTLKARKVNVSLSLLAENRYFWEIYPIHKTGVWYQRKSPPESFTLYGKQLPAPQLEIMNPKDPIGIDWTTLKDVAYSISIFRRDILGVEWTKVEEQSDIKTGKWLFMKPLRPGQYKAEVFGEGKMRTTSKVATREFFVKPKLQEVLGLSQVNL
ncbi:MAG: hypothetical protein IPK68_00930 [Bdellovibrionales bacterium]|nr:hypothetical protein [Bdellovibrionales bacterium]